MVHDCELHGGDGVVSVGGDNACETEVSGEGQITGTEAELAWQGVSCVSARRSVASSSASPCAWLALRARLHRQVSREPCEIPQDMLQVTSYVCLTTANGCMVVMRAGRVKKLPSLPSLQSCAMWGDMHACYTQWVQNLDAV